MYASIIIVTFSYNYTDDVMIIVKTIRMHAWFS